MEVVPIPGDKLLLVEVAGENPGHSATVVGWAEGDDLEVGGPTAGPVRLPVGAQAGVVDLGRRALVPIQEASEASKLGHS